MFFEFEKSSGKNFNLFFFAQGHRRRLPEKLSFAKNLCSKNIRSIVKQLSLASIQDMQQGNNCDRHNSCSHDNDDSDSDSNNENDYNIDDSDNDNNKSCNNCDKHIRYNNDDNNNRSNKNDHNIDDDNDNNHDDNNGSDSNNKYSNNDSSSENFLHLWPFSRRP